MVNMNSKLAKPIVALSVAMVLAAFVMVPSMGAVFGDDTSQIQYETGETQNVVGEVNVTVTSYDQTNESVTIEVSDPDNSYTETLSPEGDNTTLSMTEGDFTTEYTSSDTTNDVTLTHTFSGTWGVSDQVTSLLGMIVAFLILTVGVVLAKPAIDELDI